MRVFNRGFGALLGLTIMLGSGMGEITTFGPTNTNGPMCWSQDSGQSIPGDQIVVDRKKKALPPPPPPPPSPSD